MNKDITILKKPDPLKEEKLYFICTSCNAEYAVVKNKCKYNYYGNQYDKGYEYNCPFCNKSNVGLTYSLYLKFKEDT